MPRGNLCSVVLDDPRGQRIISACGVELQPSEAPLFLNAAFSIDNHHSAIHVEPRLTTCRTLKAQICLHVAAKGSHLAKENRHG